MISDRPAHPHAIKPHDQDVAADGRLTVGKDGRRRWSFPRSAHQRRRARPRPAPFCRRRHTAPRAARRRQARSRASRSPIRLATWPRRTLAVAAAAGPRAAVRSAPQSSPPTEPAPESFRQMNADQAFNLPFCSFPLPGRRGLSTRVLRPAVHGGAPASARACRHPGSAPPAQRACCRTVDDDRPSRRNTRAATCPAQKAFHRLRPDAPARSPRRCTAGPVAEEVDVPAPRPRSPPPPRRSRPGRRPGSWRSGTGGLARRWRRLQARGSLATVTPRVAAVLVAQAIKEDLHFDVCRSSPGAAHKARRSGR